MTALSGHYSAGLVSLSIIIAILAAGAALDLAGRVTAARGRARVAWLAGGAIAMGLGIWSMHFTGMLAFQLPVEVTYHQSTVLLSLLAAIMASGVALFLASGRRLGAWRIAIGSVVMGAGIAGMHYIGMAAMRLPAAITWGAPLVALSIVIAVVVSAVALWLAFRFSRSDGATWSWGKVAAVLVMGAAIPTMHYTGMFAARFSASVVAPRVVGAVGVRSLGVAAIVACTLTVLLLAMLTSVLDRRVSADREAAAERQRALVHELTVASERAKESEARFRQLTDNIPEVFYVSTADLHEILYCSPAYEQMWGQSVEGLFADPRSFLNPVHPDDLGTFVGAIERVRHGDTVEVQFRLVKSDGTIRSIVNRIVPVRDADGVIYRLAGVARDVTEQWAAREAERRAHHQLERTTAAKMAFLANMSHEIRTPMSGILGTAELLRETALTPEQHASLDVITSSGDALLGILNDILDLSKIEAGEMTLEVTPFDLPALIYSTARLLGVRAFERGLELVCNVDDPVPRRVRGDPGRLRQVLINLIGNAVKFTPRGEVVVDVRLVRRADDRALIAFTVRDTGIGISPDQRERIFSPFGQADPSTTRKYGGTGLGLSISRRLVNLMGADISVESEPGRGSSFGFQVDLTVEPEAAAVAPPRAAGLRDVRTLVVDDNATNRHMLGALLEHAGAVVREAGSASEAMPALLGALHDGHPYRLLVSDVNMPVRDGFELAQEIRDDPLLGELRVMLLTSTGRPGDGERCRRLGVAAYLQKPVSRVELVESAIAALGSPAAPGEAPPLVTRHTIAETRRSLHILLAEDNEVNQQVASAMLRKRGHVVDIVSDGRQAVDAVRAGRYDLVLMDMQMPVMGGMEATREIRSVEHDRHIPIIALTADAMAGERERCLAGGMNDYLAKPFKAFQLFAAVEGWESGPGGATQSAPIAAPDAR